MIFWIMAYYQVKYRWNVAIRQYLEDERIYESFQCQFTLEDKHGYLNCMVDYSHLIGYAGALAPSSRSTL